MKEVYKNEPKYEKKYFNNLRYNWDFLHNSIFQTIGMKASIIGTALEAGKRLSRRE